MDDLKKAVNAPERLINANELMEWLRSKIRECVFLNAHAEAAITEEIIRYVKHMPVVDAVPVVHGRWIHCKGKSHIWYCSNCGEKVNYNNAHKVYTKSMKPIEEVNRYCRSCGAKMDGERKEDG